MNDALIDFSQAISGQLKFKKRWEKKEVERLRLPPIMDHFFNMTKSTLRIPTQAKFVLSYLKSLDLPSIYSSLQKKSSLSRKEIRKAIIARAARAYPSLVRDLHLPTVLRKSGHRAFYIKDYDIKYGIDTVFKYNDEVYYIHCFVDSDRARFYREKKDGRHKTIYGKHIDLEISINKSSSSMALYPDTIAELIIQKINEKDYRLYGTLIDNKNYK